MSQITQDMNCFQNGSILVGKSISSPSIDTSSTISIPNHQSETNCADDKRTNAASHLLSEPRKSFGKAHSCSAVSSLCFFTNSLFVAPNQLAEIISTPYPVQSAPRLPIIDCRSQIDFGSEHIRTSYNINCRAKLISRKLLSKRLDEIEPSLSISFEQYNIIILYDQSTNVSSEEQICSSPIYLMLQAARKSNKEVKIVQGGFDAVKSQYPHLIEHAVPATINDHLLPPIPSTPGPIDKESLVMNEIIPHIFVGNALDAQNHDRLKEYGISHVINATPDLPFCRGRRTRELRVDILDLPSENILKHFESVIQFIDNALHSGSHNVLVHCSAGISRSPTLVLAYMIKKSQITLDEALKRMRQSRSIVDPNFSFIIQLRSWEKMCLSDAENNDDHTSKDPVSTPGSVKRSRSKSRCCVTTPASNTEMPSHTETPITVA